MNSIPPGLILLIGAVCVLLVPSRARSFVFLAFAVLVSVQLFFVLDTGDTVEWHWLGFTINPLRVDKLSLIFGYVFGLMAILGGIYAFHIRSRGAHAAALASGAAALGVVFAGDLLTLVLAWEAMALASAYLVSTGGTLRARGAAVRYLFVHLTGGAVLLSGILWHLGSGGGLAFNAFDGGTAAWLILIGFAVNAAIPPLHAWLADAYPESSVTGTVFLSAFTTKTAVYVLVRGFPGFDILVPFGVAMALYGVIFAMLQNDIRRLLAYHIISQVGFMVAAVGIGTETGINGAAAHAFVHVIYKGLLLMGAGAVLYATGKSRMSDLGGLSSRSMRAAFLLYLVGGLSISAFPLFSGFAGKSLVITAAEDEHMGWAVFLLYGASVGTFLSTTLKLPYFTWFNSHAADRRSQARPLPPGILVAMTLAAFISIAIGIYPSLLYDRLPFPVDYEPYTAAHVVSSLGFMAFTVLGFWLFLEAFCPHAGVVLDVDWLYRKAERPVRRLVLEPVAGLFTISQVGADRLAGFATRLLADPGAVAATRLVPVGIAISLVLVVAGVTVAWSLLR
ncbi:MAG: Na(+)/H(+) antiporter subunit D [Chloroflexi bacterium]|nr:Na(+)/H(+) antiporter subunit D [Chloroflexota bacterium]